MGIMVTDMDMGAGETGLRRVGTTPIGLTTLF